MKDIINFNIIELMFFCFIQFFSFIFFMYIFHYKEVDFVVNYFDFFATVLSIYFSYFTAKFLVYFFE